MASSETVYVPVLSKIAWYLKDINAHDTAGNLLTRDAVFTKLKAGDAVLLLPAGQKLHPMYQKLFHKDVVVLTPAGGP
jgi:hypothetical protein